MPGKINNFFKNVTGIQTLYNLSTTWFNEFILFTILDSLHKPIGDSNTKIEVVEFCLIFFSNNEIKNIWMINTQNTHISATSFTTLFDRLGCSIENCGKREGAGSHTLGGFNSGIMRAQTRKRIPRATTGFMY